MPAKQLSLSCKIGYYLLLIFKCWCANSTEFALGGGAMCDGVCTNVCIYLMFSYPELQRVFKVHVYCKVG